jgi:holliday junction DNA helicase RuvA
MIARIAGKLQQVAETYLLLDTGGGLWYEVLYPRCDEDFHTSRAGREVELHTIHYLEGDPTRGMQQPRLIGFTSEEARDFFRLFTSVRGLGVRKALRAMVRPPAYIAAAIANEDVASLKNLPEIGPRSAERIITELRDKVEDFAAAGAEGGEAEQPAISEAAHDAIAALVQLGEKRSDAESLVERVMTVAPDLDTSDIIQQAYRLKAGA